MSSLAELYSNNKYFLDENKDFANEMFRRDEAGIQSNLANTMSFYARQGAQEASRFRGTGTAGGEGDLQNAYASTMFFDPIQQASSSANQALGQSRNNLQRTILDLDRGFQDRNTQLYGMQFQEEEARRPAGFSDVLGGIFDVAKTVAPALIMSSKEFKKNIKKANPKQKLAELLALADKVKDYEYKPGLGDEDKHTGVIVEETPEMADASGMGVPPDKVYDVVFKSLSALKNIDSRLTALESLRGKA